MNYRESIVKRRLIFFGYALREDPSCTSWHLISSRIRNPKRLDQKYIKRGFHLHRLKHTKDRHPVGNYRSVKNKCLKLIENCTESEITGRFMVTSWGETVLELETKING